MFYEKELSLILVAIPTVNKEEINGKFLKKDLSLIRKKADFDKDGQ